VTIAVAISEPFWAAQESNTSKMNGRRDRMKAARKRERGQAILEFAVILPVFCLIGFGLVDMQFCLERAGNLEYIANETARCMAIKAIPCTVQSPQDYALQQGANLKMYPPQLVVVSVLPTEGVSCSVTLSYHFQALGMYFPNITITRTGMASVPPLG
jgi:hypothetical protein